MMESRLALKLLRSKLLLAATGNAKSAKQLALIIFFLCLYSHVNSQQNKINSFPISNLHSAYVDRPGDLYILQRDNNLKKFDIEGTLVSEQLLDAPTFFDPRDGSRAFIYSRASQRFSFFSLATKQEFAVEQHYAISPVLACSAGDNQIWIMDESDWSLKRVNPSLSKVIAEAPIDMKQFTQKAEFTFMREYQSFLFIIEKKSGILIFNSLGKQLKKIGFPEIEYINFLGEELYFKKNDKLVFYDLFDASTREVSIDPTCKFALLTDARKYLVYENRVDIFENR